MGETSKQRPLADQLRALHAVTDADAAYHILDNACTPPPAARGDALVTWTRHAEGLRRQMVGGVLGELAVVRMFPRLVEQYESEGTLVTPATEEHPVRSQSYQDFTASMNHWFTKGIREVVQDDPTAQAIVTASDRRRPLYARAVADWLEVRHRHGKNLGWTNPPDPTLSTMSDIYGVYKGNMLSQVPDQFLLLGLDLTGKGLPDPAGRACVRLHQFPALTSTVTEVTGDFMDAIQTYDPETGANEQQKGVATPQQLYGQWEREPTLENAQAFWGLADNSAVRANLDTMAILPNAGQDGRARKPGRCHIDLPLVREADYAVHPRVLLQQMGVPQLAESQYLNMSTLITGVGYSVAKDTLYKNWPSV